VEKWLKRVNARKGVQAGVNVPGVPGNANDNYQKKLKEDSEFKQKEENLMKLRDEAKKQYDYKYSSP